MPVELVLKNLAEVFNVVLQDWSCDAVAPQDRTHELVNIVVSEDIGSSGSRGRPRTGYTTVSQGFEGFLDCPSNPFLTARLPLANAHPPLARTAALFSSDSLPDTRVSYPHAFG